MRLALIGHHVAAIRPPFVGGVESLTWYLARWLARRGHEVVLFAPPGSRVPGVEVRELSFDASGLSDSARADVSMPAPAFMAAHHGYQELMLDLAETGDEFDLVHSHSLHYLPVAMSSLVPAPLVLTLHTPPTPWLESALGAAARRGASPTLNAVSESTRRLWEPMASMAETIPNGIDLSDWPAGPGTGTSAPVAAWYGRIVPEKAPHLAIEAARLAGMPLRLAGPVLDTEYWSAEVVPRLGDDIVYLGHLDHRDLAKLAGTSTVVVQTPAWEEPFGLAAAEAMATGTPVAAFRRGGLSSVVGPAAGRLAAPGDSQDLARAMREAACIPRPVVRRFAERNVGIDAMGRRYEALYARILAQSGPAVRLNELAVG